MISGEAVVAQARTFVGVPYRHQGRTRYGVDCIGLPILVLAELGTWLEGLATDRVYKRNPQALLQERVVQYCTALSTPETGCLALIAWPKQPIPAHVGILTPQHIIHAYASSGAVVETGYRAHWPLWTRSLWRMPGVIA